jgi:ribosomal protein S24E
MEIKIIKTEKKPLLERDEHIAEIISVKTPSNEELKKALSEKLKKDESLILIKRINQKFGTQDITAKFYIYSNPEAIKKFERFRKVKKIEGSAK